MLLNTRITIFYNHFTVNDQRIMKYIVTS